MSEKKLIIIYNKLETVVGFVTVNVAFRFLISSTTSLYMKLIYMICTLLFIL